MDQQQQWGSFNEAGRQPRYAPQTLPSQQNTHRDHNSAPAANLEQYAISGAPSRSGTMPVVSTNAPPGRGLEYGDRDGDIAMEDVDPYKPKQTSRPPTHQRLPSNVQQEDSSNAQRYSPMNLSPSSPFAATQQAMHSTYGNYTPQTSSRTSPTRASTYMSPPTGYYSSPPSESHTS
jgi:dual specificity protein kinase YAK1